MFVNRCTCCTRLGSAQYALHQEYAIRKHRMLRLRLWSVISYATGVDGVVLADHVKSLGVTLQKVATA